MSPAAVPDARPTTRMPSRKALATTLIIAAAAGAWAGNRLRQMPVASPDSEARPLVDWRQAREIAVAMSREDVLSMPERRKLDAEYRELVRHCVPIVSAYTGDTLPDAPERTFAFDRVDWVNANIDAFEAMFAPLEGLNLLGDAANRTVAAEMMGTLNQKVLSAEVGLLLGYLARKVLGQYDLTLLGREPVSAGKLYYVEPNIRAAEHLLGLPAQRLPHVAGAA
ncbi:MAG: zinc-dependent metalloprotease [Thermomicrobiales bacterium]